MHLSRSLLGWALAVAGPLAHAYPHAGPPPFRVVRRAQDLNETYDYVIVGGGTAGLTLADRLTEDGQTTVLVLEHGDLIDSPLIEQVQGGFGGFSPRFLYSIMSVPQAHLHNHTVPVLAGKLVGGSSAVNAMMTVRGTAADYDRWGRFFGNSSSSSSSSSTDWSWEGMLPYFRKALHFVPPPPAVARSAGIAYDPRFWGNTSAVYTGWPSFQYPGTRIQMEAFAGMPRIAYPPDSGAGETGVYWFPQFMDPATVTRSYARTGHYDRVQTRPNYQLLPGAKVLAIAFEGTAATGVTYVPVDNRPGAAALAPWARRDNGTNTTAAAAAAASTVRARREVILAAGGIHSPQVLQRSGIGPRGLLAAANISTVVDLPGVGHNFQDHPMLSMAISISHFNVTPSPLQLFGNTSFHRWAEAAWASNRTGPYSIATGNAGAWLSLPAISDRADEIASRLEAQARDVAPLLPAGTDATVAAGYAAQMRSYAASMRTNDTAFYNLDLTGSPGSGALVDLHPLSRGTVTIDPADPFGAEPLVDYRALSNPLDALVMAEMLRFTRRYYLNNTAYARFGGARELSPGAQVRSDDDFATYLAATLSPTEYHPSGTCAMLPRALGGVVDQRLRVYGTSGLRVVDASIMPTLPGANTCQTVYAIAEKAADIIKADQEPRQAKPRRPSQSAAFPRPAV